jgi:hypothetical protein
MHEAENESMEFMRDELSLASELVVGCEDYGQSIDQIFQDYYLCMWLTSDLKEIVSPQEYKQPSSIRGDPSYAISKRKQGLEEMLPEAAFAHPNLRDELLQVVLSSRGSCHSCSSLCYASPGCCLPTDLLQFRFERCANSWGTLVLCFMLPNQLFLGGSAIDEVCRLFLEQLQLRRCSNAESQVRWPSIIA